MQEMAAELDRHQAMTEHQRIDAQRDHAACIVQPLDQHAIEAERKQAHVEVVDQVPEIRRLAQREKQKEVVAKHREQHAIEGSGQARRILE